LQAWRQVGAGRDDRRKLTNVRSGKTASGSKSMPIWRSPSQPPKIQEGKKGPDCGRRPASRRLSRVIGPDMGSEENVVPPLRFGEGGSRWLSHRLTAQSRRCTLQASKRRVAISSSEMGATVLPPLYDEEAAERVISVDVVISVDAGAGK
jgi:hypothetical protein